MLTIISACDTRLCHTPVSYACVSKMTLVEVMLFEQHQFACAV